MNLDDPSDGEDNELFATAMGNNATNGCTQIAGVQLRDPSLELKWVHENWNCGNPSWYQVKKSFFIIFDI